LTHIRGKNYIWRTALTALYTSAGAGHLERGAQVAWRHEVWPTGGSAAHGSLAIHSPRQTGGGNEPYAVAGRST